MLEATVGHVLHIDPLDLKRAAPLVLRPELGRAVVVDARHHLGHAAELTRAVHREEQVDRGRHRLRAARLTLGKRLVEARVADLCRAPDAVIDAVYDVLGGVALDDEEARGALSLELACVHERRRIVFVVVVVDECERRRGGGRRRRQRV